MFRIYDNELQNFIDNYYRYELRYKISKDQLVENKTQNVTILKFIYILTGFNQLSYYCEVNSISKYDCKWFVISL